MAQPSEPSNVMQMSRADSDSDALALDESALETARHSLDSGAVTPSASAWREGVIKLLNDSLATELVCVLRYRRHHYTAHGLASPHIADEFLVHANEELAHADRIAKRISQLQGQPDYTPDSLSARSHASYDDSADLESMIKANLVAERVAIEAYSQFIKLVGDKDPATRRLLEDILADEQQHAEELETWLDK